MPRRWSAPLDWLARALRLEAAEIPRLLWMGTLVAVVLCAYTIAKVLRDALFLSDFGALKLPYAYIGVAIASVGFVWLESLIARRWTGIGAARFSQYFAIACSLAAALAYPHAPHRTAALFYVWTGSQAMMLIPHFWGLALDLWDSRRARVVFPLLTGCGLLGGLAGGALAGGVTRIFHRVDLLWSLPVLLFLAHLLTLRVEAHRSARARPEDQTSALSAWRIVRRSPFIRVFVVALALSVIVGTLVDFQFKFYLQHRYGTTHALTQFLGWFYVGLNALSLVFQFGMAGWLLQRLGLGVSTGLQPAAVLGFSAFMLAGPGIWLMIALRWTQGVLSQTLGKSCNEIYYTAIRPPERRRIKPAIDTLVERWSDAAVGVLLLVALTVMRLPVVVITGVTATLCLVWLGVLFLLDRQYGQAFEQVLSSRWIEPETVSHALRIPAARRALLAALGTGDERRIVLALQLSGEARDPAIVHAVRGCLDHEWPAVRAAAVAAMESMGVPDPSNRIAQFLEQPHEGLQRAAIGYGLTRGPEPMQLARRLLDQVDVTLPRYAVDALFDRTCEARAALTPAWIDAQLAQGTQERLLLATRALGAMRGAASIVQLRVLLTHEDAEVRSAALLSATRRPARELLDVLLPMLSVHGLQYSARAAVAATGDAAIPGLQRLLDPRQQHRVQALAAGTLAHIGTRQAIDVLMTLARSGDLRLRRLGLRGLARLRMRTGPAVLPRHAVHRLFLRELRDYRSCLDPAIALEAHAAAEVRLLGESYRESAELALERAVLALACWYEPRALMGVFERLKSRDRSIAAPAIEFLDHVLPREVFRPVRAILEQPPVAATDPAAEADPFAAWITAAWNSEDPWLRACAVRASRHSPGFDVQGFAGAKDLDPRVLAELAAYAASQAVAC